MHVSTVNCRMQEKWMHLNACSSCSRQTTIHNNGDQIALHTWLRSLFNVRHDKRWRSIAFARIDDNLWNDIHFSFVNAIRLFHHFHSSKFIPMEWICDIVTTCCQTTRSTRTSSSAHISLFLSLLCDAKTVIISAAMIIICIEEPYVEFKIVRLNGGKWFMCLVWAPLLPVRRCTWIFKDCY